MKIKKEHKIGKYLIAISYRDYKDIPAEDRKYFDVPQVQELMQLGFTKEDSVEIMYSSASIGAKILGYSEFSEIPEASKEIWNGFMRDASHMKK